MTKPTANFAYNIVNRVVTFEDHSSNGPVSWLWDFGDGLTSTSQNPLHTYLVDGYYTVTLTSTNGSGSSTPYTDILGVSGTGSALPMSLKDLTQSFIPAGVSVSSQKLNGLIKKWQLFVYLLVEPEIPEEKIHNEFAYPALVNYLIAQLVAYDLIMDGLNQYLISMGQPPIAGGTFREVKKITTGPSDAEWFSNSDVWAGLFKASAGGLSVIGTLMDNICALAHRLRISIHYCGQLSHTPIPPEVIRPGQYPRPHYRDSKGYKQTGYRGGFNLGFHHDNHS
jgi:hypothetical protein